MGDRRMKTAVDQFHDLRQLPDGKACVLEMVRVHKDQSRVSTPILASTTQYMKETKTPLSIEFTPGKDFCAIIFDELEFPTDNPVVSCSIEARIIELEEYEIIREQIEEMLNHKGSQ